jgi:2-polyprenyl-6-methoxyphenol hydroxylase-like FAD-dependent oxidoreductase
MAAPLRILKVGGGIAGLGLGRALRQQGFVPELVERAASWPAGGTGLYLPGNGVRALGALGLADKVLARAVRMPHQRILNHTGRLLADIDVAKLWNRVGLCVRIARGNFIAFSSRAPRMFRCALAARCQR